ncbi:glucose-6-phosphate isomerase [Vreelandella subglaciescola]|jgi:glucose-6-phosphate isomerase|uniref:Glucose-6-phosphate isomerase n=1 Tax=Vreelandella subglaciescola TaxID=29571 RepID=A0A1M7FJ76_9GAMM|nr:glucose-6-phosphate isomerase [Halomonas subglaciescola]SHM04066.1 glucose-6-phosphate isomerase [Halomonas subglaciescola]
MNQFSAVSPTPAFTPVNALQQHAEAMQCQPLGDLLRSEHGHGRARALQWTFGSMHVDASKQRLTPRTLELLSQWATSCHWEEKRQALFSGKPMNASEGRAALHMAARWPLETQAPAGMATAVAECQAQQRKLAGLVDKLHAGRWCGATGQPIADVLHIGVGGSDLGPKLINEALGDVPAYRRIRVHYVSTMDGAQLIPLMEELNPAATLVVLASKSFTTADTRFNVQTALAWLSEALEVEKSALYRSQLIGISAKPDKMREFGIPEAHQLTFLNTIGGRFSVWSAIGISVAMALGMPVFERLQAGAHAMDRHFMDAPFTDNLPALLGSIGAWNTQFLDISSHVVLPYDGRLKSFTPYVQQVEMESNGKSVSAAGQSVQHATSPIVWGDLGPNAQHAFYQLLHQGCHTVSADFIAVARHDVTASAGVTDALREQQALTLANCLAQSQLMALGDAAIPAGLRGKIPPGYRGNHPSTTIVLETLDAWSLGALMAMYEHKVFVQAVLWGLNPFDQPGVELGKKLATGLHQKFVDGPQEQGVDDTAQVCDPATGQLLEQILQWRNAGTS